MFNIKEHRHSLKSDFISLQEIVTDQAKGLPMPKIEKVISSNEIEIKLPQPQSDILKKGKVWDCLKERRSRRKLDGGSISLAELSYMLYNTQGVQRLFKRGEDYTVSIRTVPSAGARHPFETYLLIKDVEELERGIYRYHPVEHKLAYLKDMRFTVEELTAGVNGQQFVAEAAVVFVWSAIPYRTEWRYATESAKLILIDVGHVCQNLYITAESLELGTCGIAAYHQDRMDKILGLDGEEEMVVYLAPVGVIKKGDE